jgi:hypothetical protein
MKSIDLECQGELKLEGLDAMAVMPRCEKTSVNSDLHLVAYEDADTGGRTASILGANYRHLVRRTTTLSVPISILSIGAICSLEELGKIPGGTAAAAKLKSWLRHGVAASWDEFAQAKRVRQETLDLEDQARLRL